MKKIIIALSLFLITACCCDECVKIEGTRWKLIELNGEAIALNDDDALTFGLDSVEMTINGRTDCNRFFGSYELSDNNVIDVKMGGMTRMACPSMELEQPFVSMFDEIDSYQISNNVLVFLDGESEVAKFMIFEKVKDSTSTEE